MADRGFKNCETIINSKGATLIRPPSTFAKEMMKKADVTSTRQIASTRILIECVIRRFRCFQMIAKHGAVKYKHISKLDNIVMIVAGLVNWENGMILKE